MRKPLLFVLVAACTPSSPPPALPWVRGLEPTATSDTEAPAAADRLAGLVGASDDTGYGGLEVSTGAQTVLASYHLGIAVVRGDRVVARAPGFDAEGSADDLVALAVGDAQLGLPVIALAVTRGGRRESTTYLALYQIGDAPRLHELFSAPVEERDGDQTLTGAVTFLPNGLIYQTPRGELHRWRFEAVRWRYVPEPRISPEGERDRRPPVL